jgi:hypothetical protein
MGNSRNREHAEHNRVVYQYLSEKPEFCDWIITTAFYSSIHYVRNRMLPHTIKVKSGTKSFSDFEALYYHFRKDNEGRHGFQLNWVRDHYPEIKSRYRRLHELSNEARYIDYQISPAVLPEIEEHLETIRSYCTSK